MTSKVKNILLWVLSVPLGLMFLMAGASKFSTEMTEQFVNWGYPSFMSYITGGLEILAAIGLFIPKFRRFAAMGLIAIMIGAVGTHLKVGDPIAKAGPALMYAIWAVIIIVVTRLKTKD